MTSIARHDGRLGLPLRKRHVEPLLRERRHDHEDDEQHQHHVDERRDVDVREDARAAAGFAHGASCPPLRHRPAAAGPPRLTAREGGPASEADGHHEQEAELVLGADAVLGRDDARARGQRDLDPARRHQQAVGPGPQLGIGTAEADRRRYAAVASPRRGREVDEARERRRRASARSAARCGGRAARRSPAGCGGAPAVRSGSRPDASGRARACAGRSRRASSPRRPARTTRPASAGRRRRRRRGRAGRAARRSPRTSPSRTRMMRSG